MLERRGNSCYGIAMKDKQTSWGPVAEWYDGLVEDSSDSYQKNVIMPNIMRIVDPKPGMTVADIACGQGYFSRAFAHNGAYTIAADISAELIEKAKSHAIQGKKDDSKLEYHVAPSHSLGFLKDGSVDCAIIILALQNIEKLADTMLECSRIVKTGGRFVFVLNHPAFRIPKSSSWSWDEKEGTQYRRLDAYMSDAQIKVDMTPGEAVAAKKRFTVSFHRPLQSYFKALNKAGFAVTRFEEWISHKKSQNGPRGAEEDRIRKEIPMFVCIEARKS